MSYWSEPDITKIKDDELITNLSSPHITAEHKTVIIQELTRRSSDKLRDEIKSLRSALKKSSESQDLFSRAFLIFGIIQIVIAFFQMIIAVEGYQTWTGLVLVIILVGVCILTVRIFKDFPPKS